MKDYINILKVLIKNKSINKYNYRYVLSENFSFDYYNDRIEIIKSENFIKNIECKKENILFGSDCKSDIKIYETWYGYFIQPSQRVYKYQFEQLFLIGYCNNGYKKDKTIFIPKF